MKHLIAFLTLPASIVLGQIQPPNDATRYSEDTPEIDIYEETIVLEQAVDVDFLRANYSTIWLMTDARIHDADLYECTVYLLDWSVLNASTTRYSEFFIHSDGEVKSSDSWEDTFHNDYNFEASGDGPVWLMLGPKSHGGRWLWDATNEEWIFRYPSWQYSDSRGWHQD